MQLQVIHDGLKQIEVLNSLPSGVTIADAGGFFLYANKSAAKILGYTEQELTGKHWSFLYYPADAEVLTAQTVLSQSSLVLVVSIWKIFPTAYTAACEALMSSVGFVVES